MKLIENKHLCNRNDGCLIAIFRKQNAPFRKNGFVVILYFCKYKILFAYVDDYYRTGGDVF